MDSGGGAADEASRPATAEEEALKRNTDCVYFLASPLTCKKGSECEYRHSEGARVNPRDCWYWLNGECLNPKCAFRHPPLDPLFGVPGSKSGPAQPSYVPFQVAYGPAAYNTNKQNVPCYYFQKGQCLKGDKCLFVHGQSAAGSTNPQHVATNSPLSDPPSTNNKEKLVVKERPSQQSLPKESANKREMPALSAKPVVIASEPNNGSVPGLRASPYPSEYEHPPFELNSVPISWSDDVQSPSVDEHLQTGREVDEFLGESSPGFDVLVDDHVEDPDYFQNEEEYGQAAAQGGRNLKLLDDFDYHHSDYEHVSRFEKEHFIEGREYDRYGRSHDHPYGREHLRISSERRRERSLTPEKGKFDTDRVGESDLRHRLKQRRLNGGRSAVSPERHRSRSRIDHRLHDERSRAGRSSREYQTIQKEGFIGSRLHGRISLPVRSEVEINHERNQNRVSTGRPINYQGRLHERINRQNEDLNYGVRKYNGQTNRRVEADTVDFAGPKSLAELKCAKASEVSQDQKGLGSRDYQDSELVSLSFEGPKPLSDILKKKRDTVSGNGSSNSERRNHRDSENHIDRPISDAGCDGHLQQAVEDTKGGNTDIDPKAHEVTEVNEEEEEGMIPDENKELLNGEFSEKGDLNEEDGVIVDSIDYNETDNYDQGDVESDYGGAEGGEYKPEDDEVYLEDEEEDADDDFAKRAGFMLS